MSFDRQIDQVCTHEVYQEALFVGEDGITVRPFRPVAALSSVRVRLNSLLDVPSWGVKTPGRIEGTKSGPFAIRSGVNNVLVLRSNGGNPQTLTFPDANLISSNELVRSLNFAAQGVVFGVLEDGRIAMQTGMEGDDATMLLDSSSTLATTLGMPTDRVWRGKTVAPGWVVVNDPNTLSDRPTRLIIFEKKLRGFGDYVEVDYTTIREECRRCGGIGIEHDWRYDIRGDTIEVRDEALLIQEILKLMYTQQGSNPFHGWYGTRLIDLVASKLGVQGVVENVIVADIQQAFRRWQNIKNQQETVVGQIVSDREYPFRLLSVLAQQDTRDPTIVYISLTIQSRSEEPIVLQRGLKLPDPDELISANQPGAFRQTLQGYALQG
jgi:phage baseplate assembly protein W